MVIENSRYCDSCHGVIPFGQKHVQFRIPGTDGKSPFDYTHFHHRFPGDCWDKHARAHKHKVEASAHVEQSASA